MKKIINKYIIILVALSGEVYAGIPTNVEGVDIQSNNIIGTGWSLFKLIIYYAAWGAIGVALIVGAYTIISALGESRKKGETGILWSAISTTLVVVIVVIVIAILLIGLLDI